MPGMSGTFEHIVEMIHIINHSRKQQRSVTITLIDLQNAFGEVHHSLIQSVLHYHYIPDEISCIVKILSNDFHLSIITNYHKHLYVLKRKNSLTLGIVIQRLSSILLVSVRG